MEHYDSDVYGYMALIEADITNGPFSLNVNCYRYSKVLAPTKTQVNMQEGR